MARHVDKLPEAVYLVERVGRVYQRYIGPYAKIGAVISEIKRRVYYRYDDIDQQYRILELRGEWKDINADSDSQRSSQEDANRGKCNCGRHYIGPEVCISCGQ